MATQYRIYKGNTSGGPVDYTTVVVTTSSLSATLTAPGNSTTTLYAVRTYDTVTGLDDGNADAVVKVVVSSTGTDVTARPYAPQALRVTATAGGTARVEWSYPYLDTGHTPTGFHVYKGTGGTVSYGSVAATTTYTNRENRAYSTTLSGLTNGVTYAVGVRAFNATGEEDNTAKVSVTADSTAPANVATLTATLVS